MPPSFLVLEEVLAIHQDQIERYGGEAGIRDWSALRSAVAMPRAGAGGEYFHADLFDMAAAYLYHLVQNHAFVDGNKRVGVVAALVFLDLNDIDITADGDELHDLVIGVAAGRISKSEVARSLRSWASP